ncbi:MAG: hypothetical protein ACE5HA_10455 [Anaerolineae bacterium]
MAVVVENLKSGEATNYQGITPSGGLGNAGWGQIGTTIFAPSVKYQYGGRTGRLYILNAGSSTAAITPKFRLKDNGTSTTCSSFTLSPLERRTYAANDCGLSASGQLYGVKLTSTQPLAVVLVEQSDSGAALTASSNAFSTGVQDNDNYAPLIKSHFAGNSSGIVVQNASSSSTSSTLVDVYYYDSDSTSTWGPDGATIRAVSSHVFWAPNTVPADQVASAWISGGDKLVSTVYETKLSGNWRMQHNGFIAGTITVILPRLYKNHSDGSVTWNTGIQVQNTGTTQANVTVTYYDIAGTIVDTEPPTSIQPTRSVTFYQPNNPDLPNGFVGSAIITSDQPIVAVVNVANAGGGDAAMSYNGFNR